MSDSVEVILARIETKLDQVIDDKADHEKRIRKLERLLYVASGAAGALGGGAGAAIAAALKLGAQR